MTNNLEIFIDPAFIYNFGQGPREVRSIEDARRHGLNCVALAHLSLKTLFDYTLPPEEHCYEMYQDTRRFADVASGSPIEQGDVFWFGPARLQVPEDRFTPDYDETGFLLNWRESPVKHVAIATGETADDQPLLLHATHISRTNVVWEQSTFANYKQYERQYRVARLTS